MTGNLNLDLVISLGGVALMVAISWALGAWRSVKADEASAPERLAFDEPDFKPAEWFFSADGKAAAAISESGEDVAFVFALGDSLGTRRMRKGAARIATEGRDVTAALGDISAPPLKLRAPDEAAAARWAGRLSSASYN
ncbi:MAG TPA: hypothetical protein VNH64_02930 [Parvularculaceae bacterium]|nr:hypothetical protein [Parvularculaceae bacterium]